MDDFISKTSAMNWQEVLDFLSLKLNKDNFRNVVLEKNNRKIIEYCLMDRFTRICLTEWLNNHIKEVTLSKSKPKSKEYRMLGNNKFQRGDDIGSLKLYSKSVCYAPYKCEEFALALANRSAALFRLQYFQECLRDIDLALQSGYPDHLKHKLLLRKGKLLLISKQCQEALEVLYEAKTCMPPKANSASAHNDLEELLDVAMSNCSLEESKSNVKSEDLIPKLKNGENLSLPSMSAALDLRVTEEKGRHIVANVDIDEGDVLFVEKPYAFVVLPGQLEEPCHHCCTAIKSPIPCRVCVTAVYCSEECNKSAWKKFHQWECGGLELFYLMGIAHLGLRVTLVSYGEERGNRYEQMHSLMSHIQDMQLCDLYQYTLTATVLLLYLEQKTKFFNEEDTHLSLDTVGSQILLHICQLICNGHAITKLSTGPVTSLEEDCVVSEKQEWAATAIFPTASMMNHSCDSNIINSFCNQYLIVRALRNIPKDGEVYNCYGPHFRRMNTQERKDSLRSQYFFSCECPPCSQEGSSEFLARFSAFLCSNCKGPLLPSDVNNGACQDCGNVQPIRELIQKATKANTIFDQGLTSMENGNTIKAIELFIESIPVFASCVYRHNKQLTHCKDTLAKCYAIQGIYSKSHYYLLDCIPAVEEQFGVNSVEVGNELQKLTDIVVCELKQYSSDSELYRKILSVGLNYTHRARNIFELNYGMWNKECKDIIKKLQFLTVMQNR